MQGYIKDFRKELGSDIWIMPPLYHRTWQYLKYQVNYQERKIPMKDSTFLTIKAGQHLTSVRTIAKNIGWYEGAIYKEPNPKTISTILEWLEKQSMIKIDRGKGNRQYTLITLLNWDVYQEKESEGNSSETANKHLPDINKNVKKDKEFSAAVNSVPSPEESDGVPTTGPQGDSVPSGEISQTSEQAVQVLLNRFIQLRAHGFDASAKDIDAAYEIMGIVPAEDALIYLTDCFEQYKPKHSRDKINSLSYCVGFILDKYQKKIDSQKLAKRRISDGKVHNRRTGSITPKDSITGGQTGWIRPKRA